MILWAGRVRKFGLGKADAPPASLADCGLGGAHLGRTREPGNAGRPSRNLGERWWEGYRLRQAKGSSLLQLKREVKRNGGVK